MRETICGLVLVALCGCGTMPTGGDAGPGDSGAARGATLAGTFPAAAISAGRFCGPQASPVGTARMTVALGATAGELLLTFGDTLDAGDAGAPTPGAFHPNGGAWVLLAGDLARRMVLADPTSETPLETEGVILIDETRDTEQWNTQVARVIAVGPLAFKNRNTMQPWPEGDWVTKGSFVRAPKYGGDRFSVPHDGDEIIFVVINDLDLVGIVTGDPLATKAFI